MSIPWRSKLATVAALALVLASAASAPATAEEIAGLNIHGAGGVACGETDGPNAYQSGTPETSCDLRELSLTVMATPSERLLVGGQVWWGARSIFSNDELQVRLTQAFGQYTVADSLKVRAGVLRHPFGLYSETLEIGTLRPFLSLPRGIYSPGVFEWDSYRGLGLTGTLGGDSSWPVEYDVYGGTLASDGGDSNPIFRSLGGNPSGPQDTPSVGSRLRELVGGRVRLRTPVEGLSIGVSAYSGVPETPLLGLPPERQDAYLGFVELLRGGWSLRSEYARRDAGSGAVGDASYVEAAYQIGSHWQIAGRWDSFEADLGPRLPLPPFLQSILEHRDVAAGVNFRPIEGLVFKVSVHDVEGNFFAAPEAGVNFARGETLDTSTRLVQLGAQFSF
jgi:hypothetical protein